MSLQKIFDSSELKLFTLDEHHEAYLAWAVSLPSNSSKRSLVHIDEHADFGCPYLTGPIPNCNDSIELIKEFVYRQLTIGTFLIPSAAAGFYSDLIWIKPSRKVKFNLEHLYINKLHEFPYLDKSHIFSEVSHEVSYRTGGWDLTTCVQGEWMLDICLDAFACNSNLEHDPFILEITESQFKALNALELNMWSLRYGAAAIFFEREKRYYFELQVGAWSGSKKVTRTLNYQDRLKKLENFLLKIKNIPKVITLCRSIKSGYTPKSVALDLEFSIIDIILKTYGIKK